MQVSGTHTLNGLKLALLLFFIGHYSNTTLFYHTHEVDGRMYAHSHFFGIKNSKGVPIETHSHTNKQVDLIDSFNLFTLTDNLQFSDIPAPYVGYITRKVHIQLLNCGSTVSLLPSLRAPPAMTA
jgi:hypothetical protein